MEKKLISLVLTVLMIMSILPMSAFAAQNLPESEHPYADNMSETWVYNGKKGTKAMSVTVYRKRACRKNVEF